MRKEHSSLIFEPMENEELAFIKSKIAKDQRLFFNSMRKIAIIGFIIPTVVAIIFSLYDQPTENQITGEKIEPFSVASYLTTVVALFSLLALGGAYSYSRTIRLLKKDYKQGLKVVETVKILRKQHVELNNSFHLYIRSALRLNIEVSEADYRLYQEGDEINIEYSRHAQEYFGYF